MLVKLENLKEESFIMNEILKQVLSSCMNVFGNMVDGVTGIWLFCVSTHVISLNQFK